MRFLSSPLAASPPSASGPPAAHGLATARDPQGERGGDASEARAEDWETLTERDASVAAASASRAVLRAGEDLAPGGATSSCVESSACVTHWEPRKLLAAVGISPTHNNAVVVGTQTAPGVRGGDRATDSSAGLAARRW